MNLLKKAFDFTRDVLVRHWQKLGYKIQEKSLGIHCQNMAFVNYIFLNFQARVGRYGQEFGTGKNLVRTKIQNWENRDVRYKRRAWKYIANIRSTPAMYLCAFNQLPRNSHQTIMVNIQEYRAFASHVSLCSQPHTTKNTQRDLAPNTEFVARMTPLSPRPQTSLDALGHRFLPGGNDVTIRP